VVCKYIELDEEQVKHNDYTTNTPHPHTYFKAKLRVNLLSD